ncbi:MAG: hypothetical protein M3Q65_03320 [Chloroflexota bacterium]|nr:hypothetical protein [Chloroflexota bacterium]
MVDLKLGAFAPADAAQMQLYLEWARRHDRREGAEDPIGLLLCLVPFGFEQPFEACHRGLRAVARGSRATAAGPVGGRALVRPGEQRGGHIP